MNFFSIQRGQDMDGDRSHRLRRKTLVCLSTATAYSNKIRNRSILQTPFRNQAETPRVARTTNIGVSEPGATCSLLGDHFACHIELDQASSNGFTTKAFNTCDMLTS